MEDPRRVQDLNSGWRFQFGAPETAKDTTFDDKSWEKVEVPHTWNAVDGADGGGDYKRGAGWYRLGFQAPALPAGRRAYLCFEGVNTVATVWLNGKELGTHYGGYSGFRFDATSILKPGAQNLVVVKADNSFRLDVPTLEGDFTFFGGLYRKVSLLTVPDLSLDLMDQGGPGVYLTTPIVTRDEALVHVRVKVRNSGKTARKASVHFRVLDEKGGLAAEVSLEDRTVPSGVTEFELGASVPKPRLWNGLSDPYLYRAVVEISSDGKPADLLEQPLGIRTFGFDPEKGFILNGKPYGLHGVNLHQEREGKGYAASDTDRDEDLALIGEIGATFVRLAHYQHPQHTYDLCDRMGMVVWAEHALVNKVSSDPLFSERAVAQLIELIRQNYNHPSIVVWGIGNEVQTHEPPEAKVLLTRLAEVVKAEDPTRKSTIATDKDEAGGAYGTETIAHNKYFGWYYKDFPDLPKWLDEQRAKAPRIPMGISEYGAGAGPSIHSSSPKNQDHSEEYQCLFHEAYWKAMKERPWLWCTAVWNMFDFASDGRNEGERPGVNDKGLVTRDRKVRKDPFFWYKAHWTEEPLVYITGRRFIARTEKRTDIKVYSNCGKVTLVLNGKFLGDRKVEDRIAIWKDVQLALGGNRVEASSREGDFEVIDSCEWELKGK